MTIFKSFYLSKDYEFDNALFCGGEFEAVALLYRNYTCRSTRSSTVTMGVLNVIRLSWAFGDCSVGPDISVIFRVIERVKKLSSLWAKFLAHFSMRSKL